MNTFSYPLSTCTQSKNRIIYFEANRNGARAATTELRPRICTLIYKSTIRQSLEYTTHTHHALAAIITFNNDFVLENQ